MKEISISEFRNKLKMYAELVQDEDLTIMNNGKATMKVTSPNKIESENEAFMYNKPLTKKEILETAKSNKVEFVRLQFIDVFGFVKSVSIPLDKLEDVLENGCTFDGSSISGFARLEESDMYLIPDINTFSILPYSSSPCVIARLICDVYTTDKKPFEGDPRYILKKALRHANKLGYTVDIGPEMEFFLFNIDEDGKAKLDSFDDNGYFDIAPCDKGSITRQSICVALKKMGFDVETTHHEAGLNQHEVDFRYCNALEAADKIITCKTTVKTIAKENNLYATFMPKPVYGIAGSGMHINISLRNNNGKNVFGGNLEGNLSKEAHYFVGGLLKHAKGFCAITNPLVNSYKRLVSGYEAPTSITWAFKNRSPLVRVPYFEKDHARIELRNPDPSCNPYLALAAIIEAGLDGIVNKIEAPKMINVNAFKQDNIDTLPQDLISAIEELKKDECIIKALGPTAKVFIEFKQKEWSKYKTVVTSWELENYLSKY